MNSILAIVFACGVGAACGHDYFPAEAHDVTASDVNTQTRAMDNYFWRNEQLFAAIERFQDILFFTPTENYKQRELLLLAFTFLHYLNAETGNVDSDIQESFSYTRDFLLKPNWSNIVTAPLRTQLAKFVSAVANRVGYVHDLCKNNTDCSLNILQKDSAEGLLCPSYYHHAYLHNIALERISSIKAFPKIYSYRDSIFSRVRRDTEYYPYAAFMLASKKYANDMLQFKSVFRVLKSRNYSCLNLDSIKDHVEQSCQASCRN